MNKEEFAPFPQILLLFVYPILYIGPMSSYRNIIVNSNGTIRLLLEFLVNRFVKIMSVTQTFDQILFLMIHNIRYHLRATDRVFRLARAMFSSDKLVGG